MATAHRTAPDHTEKGWPRGVPYIIGNEGCERFSFYGMKAILYIYLTYLLQQSGMVEELAQKEAVHMVHTFVAGVYALPLIGALIADRLFGKYHTILWLSIVYCAGHACLALFENSLTGFGLGLVLIAIGSGGIKPCVSAHVGDQFGRGNWSKLQTVYMAFYFIINFGSMFATLLVPWLREVAGPSWAFGIPGILMAIATVFFWMGRKVFVHVPPSPGGKLGWIDVGAGSLLFATILLPMFGTDLIPAYAALEIADKAMVSALCLALGLVVFSYRQKLQPDDGFLAVLFYAFKVRFGGSEGDPLPRSATTAASSAGAGAADDLQLSDFWGPAARRFGQEATEGAVAVLRIASIFLFVSFFWALFDQHASSWIEQAKHMDRSFSIFGRKFNPLPSQIAATNPALVMMLIPFMGAVGYPALSKLFRTEMTPLKRMTIGMFVTAASFVIVALIQRQIDAGVQVSILWQLVAYLVITVAEVMVSITGLEFAYTQAPKRMKSVLMGMWLFSVALGNEIVVIFTAFEGMPWEMFFWSFAGMMALAACLFGLRASFYQYRTYTQ